MKLSNSEKISIASIVVTIVIAIFSQDFNPIITRSVLLVIALIMIGYLIYLLIIRYKKSKALSNAAVIAKADEYIQYLENLVEANDRRLAKLMGVSSLKMTEKINKKILKRTKGKIIDLNQDDLEIKKLLTSLNQEFAFQFDEREEKRKQLILKASKKVDLETSFKIAEKIIKHSLKLERILLQIEQYKLRIRLGKFIIKYSLNDFEIIKAYVDFIGWTNILIGENKAGIQAISQGIRIIEAKIGTSNEIPKGMDEETYYQYKFLKARALRHLSTTYYSYKKNEFNEEEIKACFEILDEENFKSYYLKHYPNMYYKMRIGLENNVLLYKFYQYQENKRQNLGGSFDYKSAIEIINQDLEIIRHMPIEEQDRHRIIKLTVFKNQLLRSENSRNNQLLDQRDFKEGLEEVRKIFNSNIYLDDALEVFVDEAIQDLYDDIRNIFEEEK